MPNQPIIDVWTGNIPADNYQPFPRNHYVVTGTVHGADPEGSDSGRPETVVLTSTDDIKDATDAVYLLDDGLTVRAHYVAGWSKDGARIYFAPFPTNPDGRTRDDGRVIDYLTWALGPRRCYHVKVQR